MRRLIHLPRRRWPWAIAITLSAGLASVSWWAWSHHALPSTDDLPVAISQQLGIDALHDTLGDATPTGQGVIVAHVEPVQSGGYLPAFKASRFQGVSFRAQSGQGGVSGHASATATIIYGPKGLAPGISQVACYATGHWLDRGMMHLGSDQATKSAAPIRLMTHSWVGNDLPHEVELLRRVDQLVDEQGVLVVAGVNNGSQTPVPGALASAYNVIAVGDWRGQSSRGYTVTDTPGRCKPDLVAPGGLTSFATPAVAALVARLIETADRQGIERTMQPLAIKAALLAGTDKPDDWQPQPGKPLDERYGAGVPRLDHSYAILTQPLEGRPPALSGWDGRSIDAQAAMTYRLLAHEPLAELSIALVWHRQVDSALAVDVFSHQLIRRFEPRLATLQLRLMTVGGQEPRTLAASLSVIDNVQYLYLRNLPAGRYDVVISRMDDLDEPWRYALSWRGVPSSSPPSASADQ